ncbi:MAG TPA: matrixin family metalloprotease, partial [Luteolibacter sp.]
TNTTRANSGVPSSVVTSTGYIHDSNGHPARFTSCDGADPIPYVVDVDAAKLPSGMDQAGALAAVQEALNAWAGSSSATFRFAGTQSFGTAAGSIAATDKILRVQLHDTYNFITNSSILGVGGGSSSIDSSVFYGGKIGTQGFQERSSAYVVLNHRASFMASAANFKQVLTHELGHALGLAHSSENSSEPNAILKSATMYYTASNDGRGAALTIYDQDRIAFGYPTTNRPPYTIDRLIPGVTCGLLSSLPLVPGCNQIRLKAVDYEGASTTPTLMSATNVAGAMTLNGNTLKFVPSGNFLDSLLTDLQISQGYNYGKAIVQFSDGVNLSRAAVCTVSSIYQDTTPSDGLPDSWMMANFGTKAVGAVGSGRNPDDDPDKDGLTNRLEFYLRTNPNSAASGRLVTSYNPATKQFTFIPQQFAPYAIEASTSLTSSSWTTRRVVTRFDTSTSAYSIPVNSAAPPAQEYYRVVVGP